jgi:predicted dehydrogenase
METTRRNFIRTTSAAGTGLLLGGCAVSNHLMPKGKVLGSNDIINVAVIGVNSKGGFGFSHVDGYNAIKGVRLAAICDVDTAVLAEMNNRLDKVGIKAKNYTDLRKLFEDKDIDAVSVVVPNHWHALATVWGCQAGKHVCVEKPVSHNIWEGRKMVEAARKYNCLVQADLDSRSNLNYDDAFDFMRKNLGKILLVKIVTYKRRGSIGKLIGPGLIPPTVNYDIWTGPAPMQPLPRQKLHYDWHWQWLTGSSELGNNGPHFMDLCRWALGKQTLPKTAMSFGGRYGYVDDGNTPNTHVVFYDYDGIPVIYEGRALPEKSGSDKLDGFTIQTATGNKIPQPNPGGWTNCTMYFVCEKGYLIGSTVYDNNGNVIKKFEVDSLSDAKRGLIKDVAKFNAASAGLPRLNFINALRNNNAEDLKTDILEGHLSAVISHMGNISYKIGKKVSPAELVENIKDNALLYEQYKEFEKHLKLNGVDLEKEGIIMGPTVTMDSQQERFVGENSEMANLFIKDAYREPFVIPEKV